MIKKEDKKEIVQNKKTELKTTGDRYINQLSKEAEVVMQGMGLELKPEVRNALFNLGLACEKAIKDKNISWDKVNKDGLPSKLLYYAQLNLNPANGELYILPYREEEKFVLNFEESYLGKKKKVKKFSTDKLIDAITFLVRDGDTYEPEVNIFGGDTVDYKPVPFNDEKIIGAVCYLKYEDDTRNRLIEMSIKDLERVKEASKSKMGGKLSPAWQKWESEMYKKAVLKRALKDVEIEVPVEYQSAYLETEEIDNSNYELSSSETQRKSVDITKDSSEEIKDAEYIETCQNSEVKEECDELTIVPFE